MRSVIRNMVVTALADAEPGASNEEIARAAVEHVSDTELRAMLEQVTALLVPAVRNYAGRELLRSISDGGEGQSGTAGAVAAATASSAPRYASARVVAAKDALLQFCITGRGARSIQLGAATVADVRFEVDTSRRRGHTMLRRAELFEEMLQEMARLEVRTVSELPGESRAKYALLLRDAYSRR